jgi:hypothetical protein
MNENVLQQLRAIEHAYLDGATYKALCDKIFEAAQLISTLEKGDPDRDAFEIFAPLLWGGASGATIEPDRIKAALAGPNGPSLLRSWSEMGRVVLAFRVAA